MTIGFIEPRHSPLELLGAGASFMNIAWCSAAIAGGWQVKMTDRAGREIQPYFSVAEYGTREDALRAALKERNTLYEKFGYPVRLLRSPLLLSHSSSRSSSGRHGIYLRRKTDNRRETAVEVVTANYPVLKTGRRSSKDWPLSNFDTTAKAIAEAAAWRDEQVSIYNDAVAAFNFLMELHRLQPAAAKEAETLLPYLPYQADSDGAVWQHAVALLDS